MRSPVVSRPAGIVQLPSCVDAAALVPVPALLQIATRNTAFLFDMTRFNESARMRAVLESLFPDERILKIGYAW